MGTESVEPIGKKLTRVYRSGVVRNVIDIGTVVGLPFTLFAVLKLLSEWAPGPLSFLADLNVWWYVLTVGIGLLGGSYLVAKRTPPPITGVPSSDHDALTRRVAELEAQVKAAAAEPASEEMEHFSYVWIEPPLFSDEDERQGERDRLGLRHLGPLESGVPVRDTPTGSYFFQPPGFVRYWGDTDGAMFPVKDEPSSTEPVELQRMHDGRLFVLGYCTEQDARRVRERKAEFHLQLFVHPWGDHDVRTRVPLDSVSEPLARKFTDGELLEMTVLRDEP